MKENGIEEKVIFYGIEDIVTDNPVWKFFTTIKRQTPNFVQFNKLPAAKLQRVVTRVEMSLPVVKASAGAQDDVLWKMVHQSFLSAV